ncbi:hypothetical protein EVAR_91715_1 [Eumeta japonica]|uniref:Uncharacterized protein n=1 Tax=Eumeta variegata TaxID=151549 RepID=A0A4C1Z5X1_EUMVA|nr:hypothetical protein EVAR_91715_1 [Eumeta japonica]
MKPSFAAGLANISPNDCIGGVLKFSFCCILSYPGLLFLGALTPELVDASDSDSSWVPHLVRCSVAVDRSDRSASEDRPGHAALSHGARAVRE